MFKEAIPEIYPLTQEYVETINYIDYEPDLALTMLGLVCFKKRLENYNGIKGWFNVGTEESYGIDKVLSAYDNIKSDVHFYYYTYISSRAECNYESLTKLGFKHRENVENIVKAKFSNVKCSVLYNENKNVVAIFTSNRGLDIYHLILSFLPLYYPNIYTTPITKADPEVKVLSTLSKATSIQFKEAISEALMEYADVFYRAQISGLLKVQHTQKINEATSKVATARDRMNELLERYKEACQKFKEAIIFKEGVIKTETSTEEEEELVRYLCANKKIRNVKIVNGVISFTVATLLQQFSTDDWTILARNGNIFTGRYDNKALTGVFKDIENRKLLFNAIFSEDAKFEVKMAGNYNINLRYNSLSSNKNFDYVGTDPMYENYLPNPHLKIFECLGQYQPRVVDALNRGDIITAFELCVFSAGSVDLCETEQTFRPLLGWIMNSDKKILRRYDGVDMTTAEALLWLIDNKENKE